MRPSLSLVFGVVLGWGIVLSDSPVAPVSDENVPPEVCLWTRKVRLAALRHMAPTPEEAEALARSLGYAEYAHPLTMCGPLTASILWEAGLLPDPEMIPDFWLLDPDVDRALLQKAFPEDVWERFDFYNSPISMFDFRAFPLVPGDVVYLYAGMKWRGFEHLLVVSYVDPEGRVYAVTNAGTPKRGYVVDEFLLYDPRNPDTGYFIWWNDHTKKTWLGGLTGTAGFTVWRMKWLMPYVNALARGICAWQSVQWDWWVGRGWFR